MASAENTDNAEVCHVKGCNAPAERSINYKKISETDLQLKSDSNRQVHLCKDHYREFKKQTKTSRGLDRIY